MKLSSLNPYQLYLNLTINKPFLKKLKYTNEIQTKLLLDIINKNKNTHYGKDHDFDLITNITDFKKKNPIQKYEDFSNYIEKAKTGAKNIITSEKIEFFAITSGTTCEPKFIPHTKSYISLRKKAWQIWINNLYSKTPGAFSLNGSILTFTAKPYDGLTLGNIKYGSVSGQIHDMQPFYIKFLYSPPEEILLIDDFELKYYLILLFSIKKNVTLIVTPNPSTLILFAKKFDKYYYNLIDDLTNNKITMLEENTQISSELKHKIIKKYTNKKENKLLAAKLKKIKTEHKQIYPKHIFTNLCAIGTWTGGSVQMYAKKLPEYYGNNIIIRDIGFMASEGTFTIPIEDSVHGDGILDIEANFYEFIEVNDYDNNKNETKLAHELEIGKRYYIIITNENGLYRYFMDDIVEIINYRENTPILRFIQKGKYFSSITGEKISEWEVIEAIKFTCDELKIGIHTFFVMANIRKEIPFYQYFIEFEKKEINIQLIKKIEDILDEKLKILNIEYKEKRNSQRLNNIKVIILPENTFLQLKKKFSEGKTNDSQIKVPKLIVIEKDKKIIQELKLFD